MADEPLPYPPHDPRPGPRNADGTVIDGPQGPAPEPAARPARPAPIPPASKEG
jgi:hypothetical protein